MFSDESATISYRLGIGMVPDDEDSQDFDVATESSLQPVTDLAGVGDDPSNDIEGLSSQMTTDITSVLDKDCNPEVGNSRSSSPYLCLPLDFSIATLYITIQMYLHHYEVLPFHQKVSK